MAIWTSKWFAVLSTLTFWTFVREFSPLGLREGRAKEETHDGESLWPNMCSPPGFLVRLCPSVYLGVTLCPASSGDAGDMWCFDRLERVPRKIDSPRLQFTYLPRLSRAACKDHRVPPHVFQFVRHCYSGWNQRHVSEGRVYCGKELTGCHLVIEERQDLRLDPDSKRDDQLRDLVVTDLIRFFMR